MKSTVLFSHGAVKSTRLRLETLLSHVMHNVVVWMGRALARLTTERELHSGQKQNPGDATMSACATNGVRVRHHGDMSASALGNGCVLRAEAVPGHQGRHLRPVRGVRQGALLRVRRRLLVRAAEGAAAVGRGDAGPFRGAAPQVHHHHRGVRHPARRGANDVEPRAGLVAHACHRLLRARAAAVVAVVVVASEAAGVWAEHLSVAVLEVVGLLTALNASSSLRAVRQLTMASSSLPGREYY